MSKCPHYSILTALFEVLPKALSVSLLEYMLCTANVQCFFCYFTPLSSLECGYFL